MNYRILTVMKVCGIGLAMVDLASAVQYRAELLHPMGAVNSSAGGAAGSQQVGYAEWDPIPRHAVLWNGSASSFVDLNPADFNGSQAEDIDGSSQVGFGVRNGELFEHALLWQGTSASAVDLHPTGEDYTDEDSFALGVSGGTQVGYVTTNGRYRQHAFLWHGTAASAIDLSPAGFWFSAATEVWGSNQVGWGHTESDNNGRHALLWNGSAESVIDLHPAGFATSEATDVWGTQQLGFVRGPSTGFWNHALLWNGSAADYIDLHPPGYVSSEGLAMSGEFQVGSGIVMKPVGYETHALVWNGTAESAIDLHPLLTPLGVDIDYSHAIGINDNGSIAGVAYKFDAANPRSYAIIWIPIPEPSFALLFASGLIAASFRRRRF